MKEKSNEMLDNDTVELIKRVSKLDEEAVIYQAKHGHISTGNAASQLCDIEARKEKLSRIRHHRKYPI